MFVCLEKCAKHCCDSTNLDCAGNTVGLDHAQVQLSSIVLKVRMASILSSLMSHHCLSLLWRPKNLQNLMRVKGLIHMVNVLINS